jgi:TPR repeat protein
VPLSQKDAAEWFRQSAEKGNAKGESNYGRVLTLRYQGHEPEPAKGYFWLWRSAIQGEPTAQNFLIEYEKGMKPKDLEQGRKMLQDYYTSQGLPVPAEKWKGQLAWRTLLQTH